MARTKKAEATEVVEAAEAAPAPAPAPAAPAAAAFGDYLVQWTIKVNGRRYESGETIALAPDAAAPFLASGAITTK